MLLRSSNLRRMMMSASSSSCTSCNAATTLTLSACLELGKRVTRSSYVKTHFPCMMPFHVLYTFCIVISKDKKMPSVTRAFTAFCHSTSTLSALLPQIDVLSHKTNTFHPFCPLAMANVDQSLTCFFRLALQMLHLTYCLFLHARMHSCSIIRHIMCHSMMVDTFLRSIRSLIIRVVVANIFFPVSFLSLSLCILSV
jgi:hypothetical protein